MADLQERARMIVDGDWWRQAGGPAVDVVAARRTARSSSARHDGRHAAVIRLAAGQLDDVTIAHELAHLLAGIDHGHDERFRAAHLDVVALLAGTRAASMLAEAYCRLRAAGRSPGVATAGARIRPHVRDRAVRIADRRRVAAVVSGVVCAPCLRRRPGSI